MDPFVGLIPGDQPVVLVEDRERRGSDLDAFEKQRMFALDPVETLGHRRCVCSGAGTLAVVPGRRETVDNSLI
jgi:hypothetical protein